MLTAGRRLATGGALIALVGFAQSAVAATQWDASIAATPFVTYSDNICLTANDTKDGWIAGLTPSVSVTGQSRKSVLRLNGSINLNTLTNSVLNTKGCTGNFDDRNRYNPQLFGLFNTRLTNDNRLRLATNFRVGQNEVSTRFRGGDDEFGRTGASNTFYRYAITPSYRERFGGAVAMNLNYTFDEVRNDNSLLTDSRRHAAVVTFKNAGKSRFSRSVSARSSVIQYKEDYLGRQRGDTELSSVRLTLGYRFSSSLSVDGSIGEEWNNFDTRLPFAQDGNAWQLGVSWRPSPRTSVRISQGDRFFGRTPRVNISHQRKSMQFTLAYRRALTFRRDITTEDLEGFPFDLENIANPSIWTETPIIDERLSAGWSWRKRGTLSLTGNYSSQTRTEDGEEAIFKDLRLSYNPQLSGIYNLSTSIGWREDEPRGFLFDLSPIVDDDNASQAWYFNATASRAFGRRFNLALSYNYTNRDGATDLASYVENRITASLGIRF